MKRVATSPALELNGISHNLLRAGSNLNAASMAIADPYLRLRPARWHEPSVFLEQQPPKVWEQLQSSQIDQISESLHQELHTFLEVFAIRLESREAALADAAAEIRKSAESVISDMQKRFDSFLEQEGESAAKVMGQRRAKLEEAGAAAQRLLQELPDLAVRVQQVESQLLQMSDDAKMPLAARNRCDSLCKKEEKSPESSVEQMRLAFQLQGLNKGVKSLEERFSAMHSRLARNEKASQQALAQARHSETMISGLQTRVEDQICFQNLRRQVREMSKTLAESTSVSHEDFEKLQRKVSELELGHRLRTDAFKIGDAEIPIAGTCKALRDASAEDEPERRNATSSLGGSSVEGLHFADGTVERSKAKEDPFLSPKRSQASPNATPSRISRSSEEPSWDSLAQAIPTEADAISVPHNETGRFS